MRRLDRLPHSEQLSGVRILVTGCGYRPLQHIFYDITTGEPSHESIFVDKQEMKLNIGATAAGVLARNGATIRMVSTSEEKLKNIKNSFRSTIPESHIEYSAVDLLDEKEVKKLVQELPKDKPIYWVQSIGLGAGSYQLKDDNPYLPLDQIDLKLLEAETVTAIKATHIMMKELLPHLRMQSETRIAVITSMSAVRGYAYGGTHCTAKGAIDRYTNSSMLALYKERIYVTNIRPGAIDTGMYDNPQVQEACKMISADYNGTWKEKINLASPVVVGEAVNFVFSTPGHISSLNIIAKGQFPHEGS